MNGPDRVLGFTERVTFSLRTLFSRYGYSQYKMNKFEEYDLYARNKDFLISDSVITFTDRNGKLMALKPDVTLSIVKNSTDTLDTVQKLYYNENVYRVTKGAGSFREIPQMGLECLGNIDDYCIGEVLTLAVESLRAISPKCILEVSHLGLLSELIDAMGIPQRGKTRLLKRIGEKNHHELVQACRDFGISEENIRILSQATATSGTPETVLPKLRALLSGIVDTAPLDQLQRILPALEMLRFDFSAVSNVQYYNGIVFQGFVDGLPSRVLSGGQYDSLMRKMRKKSRAIGFAVYLDTLTLLDRKQKPYDIDTLLLYEDGTEFETLRFAVNRLLKDGSVMVQRQLPEHITYRRLLKLHGSEVEILENNA